MEEFQVCVPAPGLDVAHQLFTPADRVGELLLGKADNSAGVLHSSWRVIERGAPRAPLAQVHEEKLAHSIAYCNSLLPSVH